MLGVTTTRAASGSTTPGTAMPMAVRSTVLIFPFFSVLDDLFDHGQDLLGSAGPRRGAPLPLEDSPRLADQRGLHLRSAHVHAQIQTIPAGRRADSSW